MRLTHLSLHEFRSYESIEIPFDEGHHLLLGPNGAGKTNILEAVHVLGTGSSMRSSRDGVLVRHGASGWRVGGRFEDAQAPIEGAYVLSPNAVAADVDGDGAVDLVRLAPVLLPFGQGVSSSP